MRSRRLRLSGGSLFRSLYSGTNRAICRSAPSGAASRKAAAWSARHARAALPESSGKAAMPARTELASAGLCETRHELPGHSGEWSVAGLRSIGTGRPATLCAGKAAIEERLQPALSQGPDRLAASKSSLPELPLSESAGGGTGAGRRSGRRLHR